jgi:hypothetical protein
MWGDCTVSNAEQPQESCEMNQTELVVSYYVILTK